MGMFSGLFGSREGGAKRISPQEAHRMMEESGKHVLLDVRSASEYRQERIKGAKSIPVDELSRRAAAELPDKDIPIYVYCLSGARASSAARLLANMGYSNVYNFGGIVNWPYKTVRG